LIQNMNIPLQTKEIEDDFILKYGLTHRWVKTAFNNHGNVWLCHFVRNIENKSNRRWFLSFHHLYFNFFVLINEDIVQWISE
jgi:hypothetical protein